jgi:hypothetical protein
MSKTRIREAIQFCKVSTKNASPDGLVWKAKILYIAEVGTGYFNSSNVYIGLPVFTLLLLPVHPLAVFVVNIFLRLSFD